MALDTKTQGITRGGLNDGNAAYIGADQNKNLLVAQGGAPFTEMTRAGGVWNVLGAAAAPVAAVPTTTAHLELYNSTSSAMVMEILDLYFYRLLGTAAIQGYGLWAMVTAPKAAPSTGSLVISSQSGRGKYTDSAATRVVSGTATTVVANGWRPFGTPPPFALAETAVPYAAWSTPVDGRLIVPPGCSLCLTATGTTAAGTVQLGAAWNERATVAAAA